MNECPICNKKHRTENSAIKCFSDVRREREHYIIAYDCSVPDRYKENYESNKRLYNKMEKYMKKQFNW